MSGITFSKKASYACPAYKDFYIQDRFSGKDIHAHDTYQYALFRRCSFQVVRKFRTRKQAYTALSNLTGLKQYDIAMENPRIIAGGYGGRIFGIMTHDKMYRLDRYNRTIESRPLRDTQLSVWYDKYAECVAEAKRIVERLEKKEQITLF